MTGWTQYRGLANPDPRSEVQLTVTAVMYNKAETLMLISGALEETDTKLDVASLSAWNQLISTFGASKDPEIIEYVRRGRIQRGMLHVNVNSSRATAQADVHQALLCCENILMQMTLGAPADAVGRRMDYPRFALMSRNQIALRGWLGSDPAILRGLVERFIDEFGHSSDSKIRAMVCNIMEVDIELCSSPQYLGNLSGGKGRLYREILATYAQDASISHKARRVEEELIKLDMREH